MAAGFQHLVSSRYVKKRSGTGDNAAEARMGFASGISAAAHPDASIRSRTDGSECFRSNPNHSGSNVEFRRRVGEVRQEQSFCGVTSKPKGRDYMSTTSGSFPGRDSSVQIEAFANIVPSLSAIPYPKWTWPNT